MVLLALAFNCILCLLSTRGLRFSAAGVAIVQAAVIAIAGLMARRRLLDDLLFVMLVAFGWLLFLRLINPAMDIKVAVDLAVVVVFWALGRTVGSARAGDRTVWLALLLVLAIGQFEWLFVDTFQNVFDIFGYYVDKGALDAANAGDTGTRLAENGVRPDERQILAFLGRHRVGSVFLEPISAGNFAVIVIAWGLVRGGKDRVAGRLWLLLGALTVGVLADARFSIFAAIAVAVAVLTPVWRLRWTLAVLPAAGLALVLGSYLLSGPMEVDNTVAGRLYGAGEFTAGLSAFQWLGMAPSRVNLDSGYSYLISGLGLPFCALAWAAFATGPQPTDTAERFRYAIGVYLTLGLLVGSSVTSIKTGALMWFLLGCLQRPAAEFYRDGSFRVPPKAERQVRLRDT